MARLEGFEPPTPSSAIAFRQLGLSLDLALFEFRSRPSSLCTFPLLGTWLRILLSAFPEFERFYSVPFGAGTPLTLKTSALSTELQPRANIEFTASRPLVASSVQAILLPPGVTYTASHVALRHRRRYQRPSGKMQE